MKEALESRLNEVVHEDHCVLPWMIRHASWIRNRFKVGKDGKTPYQRWKGKEFKVN